ncbi:hypothetical protein [Mammaliicoccus lentus]|uniref:hypothetical protein n=1 Tax=Mammaliicoccus lentus TaxID=42858 RepID=UPI0024A9E4A6|nr:hypothetical protein [Mammaliicoccus lentus]WHI54369.1 hypothetical protein PYH59_11050 [Mammaliicoccus lentus]WHI56891.1 hypothetical protein PYH49_10715 [Mammaliicoccus lentus]WHI64736.1 hypothetical protein PYH50_10720 [Mammaliicoccus lentus]WHI85630.1 hypothetical protein PYH60_10725 [Mammaliicoccus lentus]WHI90138.1 hypothetical protein PYH61_10720 [Mammaliicoccus lentus]
MNIVLIGLILYLMLFATYKFLLEKKKYTTIHFTFVLIFLSFSQVPIMYYEKLNSTLNTAALTIGLVFIFLISFSMFIQVICNILSNTQLVSEKYIEKIFKIASDPIEMIANIFKVIWLLLLGITVIQNANILLGILILISSLFIFYYVSILAYYITKHKMGFKPNVFTINIETFISFIILYIGLMII